MKNEYYTVEELVELGCPRGLIIQYLWFKKTEINKMNYSFEIKRLIKAMSGENDE